MSDASPPPDPRVLELLREESPAPADARARARARLALAVPSMGARGGDPNPEAGRGGGTPSAGAAKAAGVLGAHGVAVVAFVLGGAAGAGLHAALTSTPAPRIVYVASPTAPVPPPPIASSPPTPTPSAPIMARVPGSVGSAPPVVPPTPTSHLSQLSGERALLDEVRASLIQGNSSGALDRLRVSRREFPRAVLAEERDALTVEALVGVGRYDEARAAADAFREHFPDSLFSGAVEGAVRSIP
jgi:hypothetical protein